MSAQSLEEERWSVHIQFHFLMETSLSNLEKLSFSVFF